MLFDVIYMLILHVIHSLSVATTQVGLMLYLYWGGRVKLFLYLLPTIIECVRFKGTETPSAISRSMESTCHEGDGSMMVLTVACWRIETCFVRISCFQKLVFQAWEVPIVRRGGWLWLIQMRLLLTFNGSLFHCTWGSLTLLMLRIGNQIRVVLSVVLTGSPERAVFDMLCGSSALPYYITSKLSLCRRSGNIWILLRT